MKSLFWLFLTAFCLNASSLCLAQTPAGAPPFRVAIAGLVHGHVEGFLQHALHRSDIQLVGIAEPDRQLALRYANRFALEHSMLFADLGEMLQKTHPQAVLAYTNTAEHRRVVEICARYKIPVMMEKPLAVSAADAHAIERAAGNAGIPVLVNYVTTWYASNRAAYSLAHKKTIGDIRKIIAANGHRGPKEIGVPPEFLAWLTDPSLNGGGALYDFGCYGADLATWLMNGQRPITVTAVTQHMKPEVYPRVDDEATIILTYPKAQAIIQASWNWPFDRTDLQVFGQTGYVKTAGQNDIRMRLPGEDEQQIPASAIPSPENDSLSYLQAVVLHGKKPEGPSSLETNVIVAEILDAARRSAATGRAVRLAARPRAAIGHR